MINWKAIGIGTFCTVIFSFIIITLGGPYFLAALIGGFLAALCVKIQNYEESAKIGGISGIIGLLTVTSIMILQYRITPLPYYFDLGMLVFMLPLGLVYYLVLGVIGGVAGAYLKNKIK